MLRVRCLGVKPSEVVKESGCRLHALGPPWSRGPPSRGASLSRYQYSSGNSTVVTDRSASVMIQNLTPFRER